MTIQTQAWIWEYSRAGGADKLVQLALANMGSYGDDPANTALPTMDPLMGDLAADCGMSTAEVVNALDSLEALGEIELYQLQNHTACTFVRFREAVRDESLSSGR